MRTNSSYRVSNQPISKIQPKNRISKSKFIQNLLNSDSDQDNDIIIADNDQWIGSYEKDVPPPLLISKNENIKQNIPIQSNRMKKQIKYTSYKLSGQKLIQVPNNACQFNSLNLQQASIIRGDSQLLQRQLQKLKQTSTQQANQLNRTIQSLQNENKALKRQLNLVKQQMQTKDNYYQQLQQQIHRKTKQIQKQNKKIQQLQSQIQQLQSAKQQSNSLKQIKAYEYNSKKRQGQLSKYISNMSNISKQVYDTRKKQDKENKENDHDGTDKIYRDVTAYIVKRVEELKDRLIVQRMSAVVENIIEEFMTEIVNINPITVSRTANKIRPDCSPIRGSFKVLNDIDSSIQSRSGMLFRQTKNTQQISSRTPIKQQSKQKSNQLRNLQKSLQKLRQMQKSYANKSPTIIKDSYDSLDRSSVIGLDKSNRSKSRRKKIFQ